MVPMLGNTSYLKTSMGWQRKEGKDWPWNKWEESMSHCDIRQNGH